MFSNIPVLYPLDVSSNPLVVTTKNISRHCQMSSGGQNLPRLRTTELVRCPNCAGGSGPRVHQWTQLMSVGKGHRALGPGSPWDTVKIPFYVDKGKGFYSWGSDKVLFQKPYSASFIWSIPSFIFKLSEGRVYPFWFNVYQNTFTQAGTKYYILILKNSAETVRIKAFFLSM